jgi:hypothetical protein
MDRATLRAGLAAGAIVLSLVLAGGLAVIVAARGGRQGGAAASGPAPAAGLPPSPREGPEGGEGPRPVEAPEARPPRGRPAGGRAQAGPGLAGRLSALGLHVREHEGLLLVSERPIAGDPRVWCALFQRGALLGSEEYPEGQAIVSPLARPLAEAPPDRATFVVRSSYTATGHPELLRKITRAVD